MLQLHQVNRIWQQAPHNAFTDLIDFNGALWCVCREGSSHVSGDGALRILRSEDTLNWHSVALIQDDGADLRDAKFSQTPDGKLLLLGAGALHDRSKCSHQSYIWQSDDGANWSAATAIGEHNKLGKSSLIYLFHENYGILYMKYVIYNGVTINFNLTSVKPSF